MMTFDECLKKCPMVAILRGITPEEIIPVCDVLYKHGFRLLEIPLNTQNALLSIEHAVKHTADKMLVGAGTVLSPEDVAAVHRAGGCFIISPNTDPEVIRETKRLGLISIPGFFTASEAFSAMKAGADYLKLFPSILGPGYVKDLKAVVKKPILAVGGINAANIPDFMKVCCGVGIGSALYKPGKSLAEIERSAASMASSIA